MRFQLSYTDPDYGEVPSVYNEKDLREWLDVWKDYVGPTEIRLMKVQP